MKVTLVSFTMTLTTLKNRLACFVRSGALRNAVPLCRISLASCFTFLLIHLGNLQCHRQTCWAFSLLQRIRYRVYLSGNLPGQYTNGFLKDCTHLIILVNPYLLVTVSTRFRLLWMELLWSWYKEVNVYVSTLNYSTGAIFYSAGFTVNV